MIRVGCSGWMYPQWRDVLYPPGVPQHRWLEYYARFFDTVEVNATFYRLPRVQAVATWCAATPPDFLFAVKASRYLTHVRRLRELDPGMTRLMAPLEPLARSGRLGPLLWQLPATLRRDDDLLAAFLERLPAGRHAVEFRDRSWMQAQVFDLLRRHDVALVIGDHPDRPWQAFEVTARFSYVRLHHGTRGRRGNYSERELRSWAGRLRELARSGEVFAYCNNDWEGFAVRNARRLQQLVGAPARTLTAIG